jgi:hypothetical protein
MEVQLRNTEQTRSFPLYHYFYLYENHNGLVKLGKTQNPASRLHDYMTHRGVTSKEFNTIGFAHLFVGRYGHIRIFEENMKKLYRDKLIQHDNDWKTEWFHESVTLEDAYNLVVQELNDSRKFTKITEIDPQYGVFNLTTLESGLLTDIQKDPNKFVLSEIF